MQSYYDAISLIRKTMDPIAEAHGMESPFETWPTPNTFYGQSAEGIFLEMSNGEEPTVQRLLTPFGEVSLLPSGRHDSPLAASRDFMEKMDWKIEDVTDSMVWSDAARRPRDAGKVYAIVSVGGTALPALSGPPTCKRIVPVDYPGGYRDGKETFAALSGGKNCF